MNWADIIPQLSLLAWTVLLVTSMLYLHGKLIEISESITRVHTYLIDIRIRNGADFKKLEAETQLMRLEIAKLKKENKSE